MDEATDEAAVLGWARVLLTRRLPCLLHVAAPTALTLASLAAAETPTVVRTLLKPAVEF
jgi:hypothetical protein